MIYQKLCSDMVRARLSNATITKSILSCTIADAVKLATQKEKREPTDDECMSVIKKTIAGIEQVLAFGDKVTSSARYTANQELAILQTYMPEQLSEDKLHVIIKDYVTSSKGPCSLGDVMGYLKSNYSGKYDGKLANTIARASL